MKTYFDGWKRTFCFSGNSTRAQFWTFNIINCIVVYLVYTLSLYNAMKNGEDGGYLTICINVFFLVFPIPYLFATWSIAVRRLHDAGHSGWNLLWGVVPFIGWLVLLVYYLSPSK